MIEDVTFSNRKSFNPQFVCWCDDRNSNIIVKNQTILLTINFSVCSKFRQLDNFIFQVILCKTH